MTRNVIKEWLFATSLWGAFLVFMALMTREVDWRAALTLFIAAPAAVAILSVPRRR